jgi:hypothetical protein
MLREPSPLNPGQKKSLIEVKTQTADQQTYVLCRSEQRIAKDRAIRTKQEGRLHADINKLAKRIADGQGRQNQPGDRALEAIPVRPAITSSVMMS